MVLAVPVPVAGARAVVAQVEASAADVAGKDTDTLKIHIFILKKGKIATENPLRRFFSKLSSVICHYRVTSLMRIIFERR